MQSSWITSITIPIAIAIVFLFFKKIFPASPSVSVDMDDKALTRKLGRFHAIETFVFLVLAGAYTFLLSRLFLAASPFLRPRIEGATLVLFADSMVWLIPAMFLSLVLAGMTIEATEMSFMKDKYERLKSYQDYRYGFSFKKAATALILTIGISSGGILFLITDNYFALTPEEIVLNRFFSAKKEVYPMSDVLSIHMADKTIAPNGNEVSGTEYVVSLKGDKKFNSLYLPGIGSKKEEVFDLVSKHSGVPVIVKNVLTRADLN